MQRVTITVDDDLLAELDALVARRGYQNRSEAVRDLARAGLRQAAEETGTARDCVGALVYVFDHAARELSRRLAASFHAHHDLSLASTHVHLDHESCLEVALLNGPTDQVQQVAEHVMAERGVRYGRLVLVPVDIRDEVHPHGRDDGPPHQHVHVRPAG